MSAIVKKYKDGLLVEEKIYTKEDQRKLRGKRSAAKPEIKKDKASGDEA